MQAYKRTVTFIAAYHCHHHFAGLLPQEQVAVLLFLDAKHIN